MDKGEIRHSILNYEQAQLLKIFSLAGCDEILISSNTYSQYQLEKLDNLKIIPRVKGKGKGKRVKGKRVKG